MRTLGQFEEGYAATLGTANGRWYGGVVELKTHHTTYREQADTEDYNQYAEAVRAWDHAAAGEQHRLHYVDESTRTQITAAERICGPVAPKDDVEEPILAWTERIAGTWSLKLQLGSMTQTIHESTQILSWPAVAIADGQPVIACETRDGDQPVVRVFDAAGVRQQSIIGRHPKLAAAGGRVFVLVERDSRNEIQSVIAEIGAGEYVVPQVDAHVFNGDLLATKEREAMRLYIVCETSPRWGETQRIGELRKLRTWRFEDGRITPWPTGNILRTTNEDCADAGLYGDWPPIRPTLFLNGQTLCMAFRRNRRWRKGHSFAWDLYLTTLAGSGWAIPIRLTQHPCLPETPIGIVSADGAYIAALMQFDHDGTWRSIENTRVDILRCDNVTTLNLPSVETEAFGRMAALSPRDICLPPPELDCDTGDRRLLWGDMHRHSMYSRCMSTTDGMPDEHIRYVRNTLECDVVCLTDHAHHLSEIEFRWVMDQLETEGAGLIVLYGSEPNPDNGRHTNFYTLDPDVAMQVYHRTYARKPGRENVYRNVLEDFDADAIYAMRHVHGGQPREFDAATAAEAVATIDPRFQPALEAQQVRGNPMFGNDGMVTTTGWDGNGWGFFPNPLLTAGATVGLIGGTDHTGSPRPNKFCLTGFWADEATPQGVWHSIRERRTFSCSNGKIAMFGRIGGHIFGDELALSGPVEITAWVSCARPLKRVGLMRKDNSVEWREVSGTSAEATFVDDSPSPGRHWYVVVAEAESVYEEPAYGFLSPFYVTV